MGRVNFCRVFLEKNCLSAPGKLTLYPGAGIMEPNFPERSVPMARPPLRHAWLIITHGNFPILEKQLAFLDSPNADFFIHVDAGVREADFDRFRSIPRSSRVFFTDRLKVSWGDFSLTEATLELLRAAVPGQYDYYHLLSGVDVPLKTREYIEHYFDGRQGINFINLERDVISRRNMSRVKYYYPFQKWNIRNVTLRRIIREATAMCQRIAFVDRTRKLPPDFVFQKATEWFSITHALAEYVLTKEEDIRAIFHDTFCSDEMFLPTIAVNSGFRDTIPPADPARSHKNCLRYIDWQRGNPYTFTDGDFDELISADPEYLFARKFDYKTNPRVVDDLFEALSR